MRAGPERKPCDLRLLFRQAVDEFEISHADHEFALEVAGDTNAEIDPDRINQVLSNLLSNAANYSPTNTRIGVRVYGDESTLSFAVHNHGSVIPPDRLRDIFEPMQQVTPGGGRGHRSVGLGLYIVENIVNAHRGALGVTSTEADGTTFSVTLPRVVKDT